VRLLYASARSDKLAGPKINADGLTGKDLAERLGQMLDAAGELRATWNNLRDLIVKAGQAAQGQTAAEMFLSPGQFA
jgi:hypothetical protein